MLFYLWQPRKVTFVKYYSPVLYFGFASFHAYFVIMIRNWSFQITVNINISLCRVKPLHYISWLVGHEGKGSILSYLRKKYVS